MLKSNITVRVILQLQKSKVVDTVTLTQILPSKYQQKALLKLKKIIVISFAFKESNCLCIKHMKYFCRSLYSYCVFNQERKLKKKGYEVNENSTEFLKPLPDLNHTTISTALNGEKNYANGTLQILTTDNMNNQNSYKLIGDAANDQKIVKSFPVDDEVSLL